MYRHTTQLVIENLASSRGGRRIFQGVSFSLFSGQGVLLKGPNGAGKTTLLRTLAGFITPFAGKINFDTVRVSGETPFPEHCHYIGHLNGIKKTFTVHENLEFMKAYLSLPGNAHLKASQTEHEMAFSGSGEKNTSEHAVEIFDLSHLRDIPAGYLSAGQKRRVALARLIVVPRLVWLLDEPTVSLDQASQELLCRLMRNHLDHGGIIVAVSHIPLGIDFHQTFHFSKGKLLEEISALEEPSA